MALKKYRLKRNFKNTGEPYGVKPPLLGSSGCFVVQKHAASHLHYDFRLEISGVLKSWAVPKGPSLDPSVKRLAVHVEDHPLEYGSFEGNIPKGEYGGGTVMLWDKGTWEIIKEKNKGYKQGNFTFILHGQKLRGLWKLVQINKDPKNWLLIKVLDKEMRAQYDIEKDALSVSTGRSLSEIAAGAKPHLKPIASKKAKIPDNISPQLATLVDKPPSGDNWLHEVKYDGYRLICHIDKEVKFLTRGQQNWTKKFLSLAKEIEDWGLNKTILDGEVVALDDRNLPNFQALQNTLHPDKHPTKNLKASHALIYYVFDLLYYEGRNLSNMPLLARKALLRSIIEKYHPRFIKYSDHIIGSGEVVFKQACELSFEGIVSKAVNSPYSQKRTKTWLKSKCINRQEFLVCGYTRPTGNRQYFGSLLLGYYDKNKKLCYAGHVGTGFNARALKNIFDLMNKHATSHSPFKKSVNEKNLGAWLSPKIVVEVEFLEWTSEGILRHPSFKGLREDKPPKKINLETKTSTQLPALVLSHPDKILYPQSKVTKIQIAEYYQKISEWMLPFIINRPLTVVRCPHGIQASCFYQKHLTNNADLSDTLFSIPIQDKTAIRKYIFLKNINGLLKLVQMNVLEIHLWNCKIDNLNKPDMLIFDLDPAPNVPYKEVIQAAFIIKEELENYHLECFVKMTGGKGLHLVIPIQRRYSWEYTLHFCKTFVLYLEAKYPQRFVATMTKSKRTGKIFIDYFRNHHGATAIAPYSTRAREQASIAVPVAWNELSVKLKPDCFNINNIADHMIDFNNPWGNFFSLKQGLPKLK